MTLPYRVGLTGGIGSGKSVVAGMFSDMGVPVIDADVIAHELTAPGNPVLRQIVDIFGKRILDTSGHLNRSLLGEIIFADEDARHKLEALLHPLVYENMENQLEQLYAGYCILSIPLLLETGAQDRVDSILVVDSPVELQIERVCKRDGLDRNAVEAIIKSQIPRKARLDAADDIITNDGDIVNLTRQVQTLHKHYQQKAASSDR